MGHSLLNGPQRFYWLIVLNSNKIKLMKLSVCKKRWNPLPQWTYKPKETQRVDLSPGLDIAVVNGLRWNPPRAGDPRPRQSVEIKLTTDFGVGPAGMGHVVAVKRHHVAEHIC